MLCPPVLPPSVSSSAPPCHPNMVTSGSRKQSSQNVIFASSVWIDRRNRNTSCLLIELFWWRRRLQLALRRSNMFNALFESTSFIQVQRLKHLQKIMDVMKGKANEADLSQFPCARVKWLKCFEISEACQPIGGWNIVFSLAIVTRKDRWRRRGLSITFFWISSTLPARGWKRSICSWWGSVVRCQ